jgi:hypothetical protein
MNTALASGFVKEAAKKDMIGIGLGALGAATGAAGLVQAQRTRKDVTVMRGQSRAADSLHSAMLYEARTGQKIPTEMRTSIGKNYMAKNQAFRRRFGKPLPSTAK